MRQGIIGAALLALAGCGPVHAETACGDHAAVARHLGEAYGEARRGLGLAANGTVLEFWSNATSGSWTVTMTRPDGRTCLVASGDYWRPTPEDLPVAGDPA